MTAIDGGCVSDNARAPFVQLAGQVLYSMIVASEHGIFHHRRTMRERYSQCGSHRELRSTWSTQTYAAAFRKQILSILCCSSYRSSSWTTTSLMDTRLFSRNSMAELLCGENTTAYRECCTSCADLTHIQRIVHVETSSSMLRYKGSKWARLCWIGQWDLSAATWTDTTLSSNQKQPNPAVVRRSWGLMHSECQGRECSRSQARLATSRVEGSYW